MVPNGKFISIVNQIKRLIIGFQFFGDFKHSDVWVENFRSLHNTVWNCSDCENVCLVVHIWLWTHQTCWKCLKKFSGFDYYLDDRLAYTCIPRISLWCCVVEDALLQSLQLKYENYVLWNKNVNVKVQ